MQCRYKGYFGLEYNNEISDISEEQHKKTLNKQVLFLLSMSCNYQ